MKKYNYLYKLSSSILIGIFLYLFIQIYTLIYNLKYWVKYNSLFEIILGLSREICEILYIPLWGIVIAFSLLFFNYWINDNKE